MYKFITQPSTGVATYQPLPDSFFDGLLSFYKTHSTGQLSDIWKGVIGTLMVPLHQALESENRELLRLELTNLYLSDCIGGFDCAIKTGDHQDLSDSINPLLLDTCSAWGIINQINPEQDVPEEVQHEHLIEMLEHAVGCRLHWSGGGGVPVIKVGDRDIPYKTIQAACSLATIRKWCPTPRNALEIGAGFGFLAHLITNAHPYCKYHIVDLPIVSVIQKFLLNGSVTFHGTEFPEGQFELVINENSLPECATEVAEKYIKQLVQSLVPGGIFYSFNHESTRGGQVPVSKLMWHHENMRLVQRSRAWGREYYLDEVWVKT